MKKSLSFALVFVLILISCKKNDTDVFFRIGKNLEYKYSDIELYDSSTHVLYFRTVHDEFKTIDKGSFVFLDKGDAIFSGTFWPGYSSMGPNGPFIFSPPSLYGCHALRIENWSLEKPDVRNDPRMISVLKQYSLLHSGLSAEINSVEKTGTQLLLRFTVTNNDQSDLLILDPEKTGVGLFHYFTNGLSLYDINGYEVFSGTIQHETPEPWNGWKPDWLSELKSGESRSFSISYPILNPLSQGEYRASFAFPGLEFEVSKDQLMQADKRIWLGDKRTNKWVVI
jgi:hypothetical protein